MVRTVELHFSTQGGSDVLDITPEVQDSLREAGMENGVITIFSPSSTSALTTIEYESGCVTDIRELFEKLIPQNRDYRHNARWGDGNGHSHLRAALLGPSLSVPFVGGKLTLGTWQQIVFVDFDNRPRSRRLVVQVVGE